MSTFPLILCIIIIFNTQFIHVFHTLILAGWQRNDVIYLIVWMSASVFVLIY